MSDSTSFTGQPASPRPTDNDLDFAEGPLSDDDPDVVRGVARLQELRANENQAVDIFPPGYSPTAK